MGQPNDMHTEPLEGAPCDVLRTQEFEAHLKNHLIRNFLKDLCKENGHSFEETFEEHEGGIILVISIGGKEKGSQYPDFFESDKCSDQFTYKWDTIIRHYGLILEYYLDQKNNIPADL